MPTLNLTPPWARVKSTLLFSLFFMGLSALFSQTNELLSLSANIEAELTSGQKDFRQNMLNNGQFSLSQTIQINDIQNCIVNGKLDFSIPGEAGNFTAIQNREEKGSSLSYDYLWSGKIDDENPGEVLILQKDGLVGGFIQTSHDYYVIFPIQKHAAFLMKFKPQSTPDICGNDVPTKIPPPQNGVDLCSTNPQNCDGIIDALVLVTPEAQAFFAGIPANSFIITLIVHFALEMPNIAFFNSEISNTRIRTTLTEYSFNYDQLGRHGVDIINLAGDPDAQKLRDEFRADLVIMLTNQGYSAAGIVKEIGPEKKNAYAIVEVPFLFGSRMTYAHEIGHLFGARHRRPNNGGNDAIGACQHARRFTDVGGATIHTVVVRGGSGPLATKIPHYSNPDVIFNGTATGTEDDNNALAIKNSTCEISRFYPEGTYLGVKIFAPTLICVEDGDFTATALVNEAITAFPGHPPYTYNWSTSGGSCGASLTPQGDGSQVYVGFSCFDGGTINLQVTVTSADGETTSHSRSLTIQGEPCFSDGSDDRSDNGFDIDSQKSNAVVNGYSIYPNPVSHQLTIEIPEGENLYVIELLDTQGKLLRVNKDVQRHFIKLDFSGLPDGLYLLKLGGSEKPFTQKIIKGLR